MTRIPFELDPATKLTVDAIGKPGERVFYLQGKDEEHTVTLLIEKVQVIALCEGLGKLLAEIAEEYPERVTDLATVHEEEMRITPPVDPVFRVGDLGLGYDGARDSICVVAKEIPLEGNDPEEIREVRFWCTREHAFALQQWGIILAGRGRPICPQCGQPMEPEGHFCPKKNGHK